MRAVRSWNARLAAIDEGRERSNWRLVLDLGVLATPGIGIVALTIWMAQWPAIFEYPREFVTGKNFAAIMLAQLALYGLAAGWVIWRKPDVRWTLLLVILIGLAGRLAFVPQVPAVSTDIYRYVWDGRVQSHGINPYRYAPDDPALEQFRDEEIYPDINRKSEPTIYPPVAQTVFRAVYLIYPDSTEWTRIAFILLDLVTIGILIGLLMRLDARPDHVLLYAWHPLVILELGHSGHVDIVAVLFLILAVRARMTGRAIWTGILLAFAALVKFYAIVALPALLRPDWKFDLRMPGAFVATVALAYLPFLGVGTRVLGYLPGYLQEEGISSGRRFFLLEQIERVANAWQLAWPDWLGASLLEPVERYQLFVFAIMAGLALWCWLRPLASKREIASRALLLFVVLFVLSSPSYAWYALLPLVFLPLVRGLLLIPALVITGSVAFLYLQYWWPGEPDWPTDVVYGAHTVALALTIVLAALLLARRRYGQVLDRLTRRLPTARQEG